LTRSFTAVQSHINAGFNQAESLRNLISKYVDRVKLLRQPNMRFKHVSKHICFGFAHGLCYCIGLHWS